MIFIIITATSTLSSPFLSTPSFHLFSSWNRGNTMEARVCIFITTSLVAFTSHAYISPFTSSISYPHLRTWGFHAYIATAIHTLVTCPRAHLSILISSPRDIPHINHTPYLSRAGLSFGVAARCLLGFDGSREEKRARLDLPLSCQWVLGIFLGEGRGRVFGVGDAF